MSQSIMDLHSTVILQNKGMLELLNMITDQGISIRENIAEGMELIRGKTILIAEAVAEDRPKILQEAQESQIKGDNEVSTKLLEKST